MRLRSDHKQHRWCPREVCINTITGAVKQMCNIFRFCLLTLTALIMGCSATNQLVIPEDELDLIPRDMAASYINENSHFEGCEFHEGYFRAYGSAKVWVYEEDRVEYYLSNSAWGGYSLAVNAFEAGRLTVSVICYIFYGPEILPPRLLSTVKPNRYPVDDIDEVTKMLSAIRSLGIPQQSLSSRGN